MVAGAILETELPGVLIIERRQFGDERGSFSELFRKDRYASFGVSRELVQDNHSHSRRGVIRGLHLQNPHQQGKLVCALRGRILDVAVDVRHGSPTFGNSVAVELSRENGRQLWIPRGFAHGFSVLSDEADVFYKCDDLYSPESEITILYSDPALNIDWRVDAPILSSKDMAGSLLSNTRGLPLYERF